MKKVLLMTLALMVCAGAAMADQIGVFADQGGLDCIAGPLVSGNVNSFYLIHKFNADGATAAQFKVNDTTGLFAANQLTPFLAIGTWNTDLSLAYGGCLIGDVALMTLNFFWFGNALLTCSATLEVAPAPTSPAPGEIALVECDFQTVTTATGGRLTVRTDDTDGGCPGCVVAAQTTTWGGVKALYR